MLAVMQVIAGPGALDMDIRARFYMNTVRKYPRGLWWLTSSAGVHGRALRGGDGAGGEAGARGVQGGGVRARRAGVRKIKVINMSILYQ